MPSVMNPGVAGGASSGGPIVGLSGFARDALSTFTTSLVGATPAVYTDMGAPPAPLIVSQPWVSGAGNVWDYRVKAPPALPYSITAMCEPFGQQSSDYSKSAPIMLVDSAGKFIAFCFSGNGVGWEAARWSNPTSFSNETVFGPSAATPQWLRVEIDGTNIYYYMSPNGIPGTFQMVLKEPMTSFLAGAPVGIGFGINESDLNSGLGFTLWNWAIGA